MSTKDLTFNSIDVETANSDLASICQIGIVHVVAGNIVDSWKTYVNPEDWFDPRNIGIHGIEPSTVRSSPTMPEIRAELRKRVRGSILVSHTWFDRVAFERAMNRYYLEQLQVRWLDGSRIARKTWKQYEHSGYGLKDIALDLGIKFEHHDALEDARASAEITIRACSETGIGIDEWVSLAVEPIRRQIDTEPEEEVEVNQNGHLFGESVVFTGTLSISRKKAVKLAKRSGCEVFTTVSRTCTILVSGLQNRSRLNGYSKSSKHRKAEELNEYGHSIQIISESDFFELVGVY